MRRFYYIYIIICSLLMVACSNDDHEAAAGSSVAINFDANVQTPSPTTRAKGEINEAVSTNVKPNDELSYYGGFGVFACYTGLHRYSDSNVRPDFMYNEHVTYDTDHWTYSPMKYWPNGEGTVTGNTGENKHYVSFMAYAPYSDNVHPDPENRPADYCIPSFSLQGEIGNPWLTYRLHSDVAKQVDLLYASHTNEHPILDQTKPTTADKVHFVFEHALACVGDRVTIDCSSALKSQIRGRVNGNTITKAKVEVTALSIEYTLTSKARLVLWNNGSPNWQTIFSEDPICTRTVTFLESENSSDDEIIYEHTSTPPTTDNPITKEGLGVYYIPVEFKGYQQTAVVTLTYNIASYNGSSWKNESTITGTASITLSNYPDAFQSGKHLYINVTLNPMDIELRAAIAPWVVGDPVEIEGVED